MATTPAVPAIMRLRHGGARHLGGVTEGMRETDQQRKWLDAMRRRSELMNDLYERIAALSAAGDRQGIVELASRTLEAAPIENGNRVVVGSLEIEFDDTGRVTELRSDDGTATFSVKPATGADDSAD